MGFELEGEESFNVIIIEECTPVLYDKDGNEFARVGAEQRELV